MTTTIAVLGATGKAGRGVVRELLAKEDVTLHLYVRSRQKLEQLVPSVSTNPRVKIFQGQVTDVENMTKCLAGVQTIIFTLGENLNIPGVRVIQDGAASVMAALENLQKVATEQWHPRRMIMLSSSTWNKRFAADRPPLVHWALKTAFTHPYADLLRGQEILLAQPSLLSVLLVQPPALVEEPARGFELSTVSVKFTATYGDLAAAMVETALVPEYLKLSEIGVSTRDGDQFLRWGPTMAWWVIKGLSAQFIPGYWTINSLIWGK